MLAYVLAVFLSLCLCVSVSVLYVAHLTFSYTSSPMLESPTYAYTHIKYTHTHYGVLKCIRAVTSWIPVRFQPRIATKSEGRP